MNYRMTQPFKPPFRINALIEETGPLKVVSTPPFNFLCLLVAYYVLTICYIFVG